MEQKATGPGDELAGDAAIVVLVTGPGPERLRELGRTLVEERLAACVNVVPGLRSVFRWEGEVQEEDEALALIKSTAARARSLQRRVRELHPYDEPEFLALSVASGSPSYLEWIVGAVEETREGA